MRNFFLLSEHHNQEGLPVAGLLNTHILELSMGVTLCSHTLLQLADRVGSGVHFALSATLGCREDLCPAAYQKLDQGLVLSSCQWPVS